MIRHDIYVTPPWTPEPERPLLFDEGFDRRTLETCENGSNLVDMDLNSESGNRICLSFRVSMPSYQIGVPDMI